VLDVGVVTIIISHTLRVEWPRGEATACKAVYTGSNPVSTSKDD
jgi:hypothetical protein